MNQTKLIRFAILGVIILMVLLIFSNSTFVTINSGERGVQFKKFAGGLDKENTYDQGFHFVLPWNEMIKYEVREQIQEEAMDVILGEGLGISMDVAVRFRPIPNKIGYLHDELGPNYKDIVVKNAIRSAAREVASKFAPEEVYSTKKDEVRILIEQQISPILQDRYLELIRVDIRDIKLPPAYKEAIEAKLEREQAVQREQQEAERKIIEANGEAERKIIEAKALKEFQEIINQGITEKYLKLKGIEATLELAKSPNSKVVVIGTNESSMPIILGGEN